MAKVDRLGPNGEFYNNRFNDGKCDPMGRLWAGRSLSLWLKSFLVNHFFVLKSFSVNLFLHFVAQYSFYDTYVLMFELWRQNHIRKIVIQESIQ